MKIVEIVELKEIVELWNPLKIVLFKTYRLFSAWDPGNKERTILFFASSRRDLIWSSR